MLKQPTNETIDASYVAAALAECEAIISSDAVQRPAPEIYAALFDELCEKALLPLSAEEKEKLNQAMEDVRWAWWQAKRRQGNGSATLRKLMVHSSQLHTVS